LRSLGVIDPDETVATNESTNAIEALNLLLYQLRGPQSTFNQSVRMWQIEYVDLTLNSSAGSYIMNSTAGANIEMPLEIRSVALYNSSSYAETVLEPMTEDEFYQLPNKSTSGTPTRFYYQRKADYGTLYFDFIPSSTIAAGYVARIYYRQPIEVIANSSDSFDVQPEWFRALKYMLARDIASEYPEVTQQTLSRIDSLAIEALTMAQMFEPELSSIFFTFENK